MESLIKMFQFVSLQFQNGEIKILFENVLHYPLKLG